MFPPSFPPTLPPTPPSYVPLSAQLTVCPPASSACFVHAALRSKHLPQQASCSAEGSAPSKLFVQTVSQLVAFFLILQELSHFLLPEFDASSLSLPLWVPPPALASSGLGFLLPIAPSLGPALSSSFLRTVMASYRPVLFGSFPRRRPQFCALSLLSRLFAARKYCTISAENFIGAAPPTRLLISRAKSERSLLSCISLN